jgi:hypothetical protein
MHKLHFSTLLVIIATLCTAAGAQEYKLTGKSYEMTWSKGTWNGAVGFPGVFCATLPAADKAESMTQAMFNNNGIYLARIEYPESLTLATIATSTVPPRKTPEEEMELLLALNRRNQSAITDAGARYDVTELRTEFGATIGLTLTNVSQGNKESGPFPLSRKFSIPKDGALRSMSVHRLFVRGSDRFEIAVLQLSSGSIPNASEADMESRLTSMADALVRSLQACTAQLPIRIPKY